MLNILKKEKNDLFININLNNKSDYISESESINKKINDETEKSIKMSNDLEYICYKPSQSFTLFPFFKNNNNYIFGDFKNEDFITNNEFINESFYIFDMYDTSNILNRTLLSRNFSKLKNVLLSGITPVIEFSVKNITEEYTNIYVPNFFNEDKLYMEIQFFNSRNGKLRVFKNLINEYNMFEIILNKENNTYSISDSSNSQYDIFEIIEEIKEKESNNGSKLKIKNIIKTKKTITTKGIFI